jgi:hypothetical protein
VPRAIAAITSRRRHPWLSPTLAARGIQSPAHLPAAGGEGEGEEEEEPGAAPPAAKPELRHLPRSRSRPRGGAGPAGATHACDLCFIDFLSAAPFCVPYQRRLPPRHSAAHPSPTPAHRPEATQVRTPPHLPCGRYGLRAEAERPRAAAPLLVRPAIEPGWDANFCRCRRLRRRARHPPSISSLAIGHRHRSSPPRRVGAPRRVRDACVPARARLCGPWRSQACTTARVRHSREGKAGPWAPFLCLALLTVLAELAAVHRVTVSPWPWEARARSPRKAHRVFGRLERHTVHPVTNKPANRGRRARRRPWRRAGLRRDAAIVGAEYGPDTNQ